MSVAHPPAGDVEFTYNAVWQRIAKETTSDALHFLYDGLHLLEESDGANDPLREYTFGGEILSTGFGDLVSEYDYDEDETLDHAYDAQWSTEALLDPDEDQVAKLRYRAFGLPTQQDGPASSKFTFVGKQGYCSIYFVQHALAVCACQPHEAFSPPHEAFHCAPSCSLRAKFSFRSWPQDVAR